MLYPSGYDITGDLPPGGAKFSGIPIHHDTDSIFVFGQNVQHMSRLKDGVLGAGSGELTATLSFKDGYFLRANKEMYRYDAMLKKYYSIIFKHVCSGKASRTKTTRT